MAKHADLGRVDLIVVPAGLVLVLCDRPVDRVKQLRGLRTAPAGSAPSAPATAARCHRTDRHNQKTVRSNFRQVILMCRGRIGATSVAPGEDRQLHLVAERRSGPWAGKWCEWEDCCHRPRWPCKARSRRLRQFFRRLRLQACLRKLILRPAGTPFRLPELGPPRQVQSERLRRGDRALHPFRIQRLQQPTGRLPHTVRKFLH